MAYKNTFELISKDIQDIEKLVANFQNYSRIPGIELDLALSKLRNVYDILLMFRENSPEGNSEAPGPSESEKPAIREEKTVAPSPSKPVGEVNEPEKQGVEPPKIPRNPGTDQILAEKFKSEQAHINEIIGANSKKSDLSARLNASPIKSISGSIGINDKFFFIRELFAGNAESFRQAMNTLDEADNFNNAYNYLVKTYGWDMDSEAVQQLLNLIRRKFISRGNE